ncbi:hypothetical protein EBH_0031750 [Eimeria brunetti]|uniref:Uncharacterized protein n=1 Tax=Eimeria brunetti TaxID=51314 RepID=U6LQX7_9EIME|nr:hypothetical protein EBH_0031750 [Eimeria brunetti]
MEGALDSSAAGGVRGAPATSAAAAAAAAPAAAAAAAAPAAAPHAAQLSAAAAATAAAATAAAATAAAAADEGPLPPQLPTWGPPPCPTPAAALGGPPQQGTGAPQAATGGPPKGTGGPPEGTGAPQAATGGPPKGTGGPPEGTGGPPKDTGGPPEGTGAPPKGTELPPEGTRGPPEGPGGPPEGTGGPQGAPRFSNLWGAWKETAGCLHSLSRVAAYPTAAGIINICLEKEAAAAEKEKKIRNKILPPHFDAAETSPYPPTKAAGLVGGGPFSGFFSAAVFCEFLRDAHGDISAQTAARTLLNSIFNAHLKEKVQPYLNEEEEFTIDVR